MVSLSHVQKSFFQQGRKQPALLDINLEIAPGEFVVLFGPNGSGKTTLLTILSGLDRAFEGTVSIGGKTPEEAKIGLVFQNYNDALFPWKTVIQNVTYPLLVEGVSAKEAEKKGMEILKRVGLQAKKDSYIYLLSGGQRQLVSICRAFVRQPEFLVLDEPCSALDYSATKKIELEIQELWMHAKIPALCVSHDIDEAVFLADRVVVLSKSPGKIKAIIPIDLPRPRTLATFTTQAFFNLRSKVLEQFLYE